MSLPVAARALLLALSPDTLPGKAEALFKARNSRRSWRVRLGSSWVVLKPARPGALGLALARHEFLAMRWAWEHALAPRPLGFDPLSGWLAYVYVSGTTPWRDCPLLTKRLQVLHALPLPAWPRFDPLLAAAYSVQLLTRAKNVDVMQRAWLTDRLAEARQALRRTKPGRLAPCHNDVQPFNVVRRAQPLLLDWESAALGDPLWDTASWAESLDLPQQPPKGAAAMRLSAFRSVAKVYFAAWGLRRPHWRDVTMQRLARWMAGR